jgi:prepilin-type N-terminal cleavage/methylation domain-containing protein
MKKVRRGEGGFTLLELLIVIAILGIIAAVVVLNLSKITGRGYVEAANAELDAVRTATQVYYIDNGSWPAITDEIVGDADVLDPYMDGVTNCKYTVDAANATAAGDVTGTGATGKFVGKVTWDDTNKRWK